MVHLKTAVTQLFQKLSGAHREDAAAHWWAVRPTVGTYDLEDSHTDIACLQETWLSAGDKSIYRIIQEHGFEFVKQERTRGNGGGLVTLFRPYLDIKKLNFKPRIKYKTFEYLCVKLPYKNSTLIIINLYRVPYSKKHPFTIKMFLEEFMLFLLDILEINGYILIEGDFNINLNNDNDSYIKKFNDLMLMNNLRQLIKSETHIRGGLIDLIFVDTRLPDKDVSAFVDTDFQTDHYPLVLKMSNAKSFLKKQVIVKNVSELHKLDIEKFRGSLVNTDLTRPDVIANLSLNKSILLYNNTLSKLMDDHCPMVSKRY